MFGCPLFFGEAADKDQDVGVIGWLFFQMTSSVGASHSLTPAGARRASVKAIEAIHGGQ